jgi:hypothetical protein
MDSGETSAKRRTDRRDALLWLTLPLLLLALIPIGSVSADGIGQSGRFAAGSWRLNPNHLLFEPLGAAWQSLLGPGAPREAAVDHLKRLSLLAGALAAALFRIGIASRLATSRFAANHATAWLALSSAFSRLWVSEETHMIQMPAVVLVAALALLTLERPTFRRGLATGMAVALAAACFVSNLLLAPALAVALSFRARWRAAGGVLAGTTTTAGLLFSAAWLLARPGISFLAWLTHYSGTRDPRLDLAYGLQPTLSGIFHAAARAVYGAASALVDLAPAVAAIREGRIEFFRLLACLAACAVLGYAAGRSRKDPVSLLAAAMTAAVVLFGFLWDNSDDQFYFQLAVVAGMVVARLPLRPAILVLSGGVLLWNVGDLVTRRVFYPRAERLAILRTELGDACLVVYPGYEDLESLLTLAELEKKGIRRLSVTSLATSHPPGEGLAELSAAVASCGNRPVALVDLYDTPPDQNPWQFLRRLGYERAKVQEALSRFPVESASRPLGPFTLRWLRSRPRTPA